MIQAANKGLVWNVEVTLLGLILSCFEIQEKSMSDSIELVDIAGGSVNNPALDFHIKLPFHKTMKAQSNDAIRFNGLHHRVVLALFFFLQQYVWENTNQEFNEIQRCLKSLYMHYVCSSKLNSNQYLK